MFTRAGWTTDAVSVVHRCTENDFVAACLVQAVQTTKNRKQSTLRYTLPKDYVRETWRETHTYSERKKRGCANNKVIGWTMSLHNQQQHRIRCAAYVRTLCIKTNNPALVLRSIPLCSLSYHFKYLCLVFMHCIRIEPFVNNRLIKYWFYPGNLFGFPTPTKACKNQQKP